MSHCIYCGGKPVLCRICRKQVGKKGDTPARVVGIITKMYIHERCMGMR